MSRRGDHIHKRKDGRWEGRYKCGLKNDGTTAYGSVYAKTYTECKSKLEKCKTNFINLDEKHTELKFSEVLELWLSSNRIRVKGATENKYSCVIESHILPELGNKRISTLTPHVINVFLDRKIKEGAINGEGGLSPAYVKTIATIIESALKYAACEGMCSPLKSAINKPSIPKKELNVLSHNVQKNLEQALILEKSQVALGTLIALYTGLRIGEICALQWCDIDLNKDIITVRHTVSRVKDDYGNKKTKLILDTPKTKASKRNIPISSLLKPILQDAYDCRKSNFVVSKTNSFVGTRTFDYRFRQMMKRNNFEIISFHTIRHTFATRCVEAGMDAKTLSEILGHASVSTTMNIYVHSSMEVKRNQIEKVCALA